MIYKDLKTITAFCNEWNSLFSIGAIHVSKPIDKNRALMSVKIKSHGKSDPRLDDFINRYFPKGDEIYDVQSCADALYPY